VCDKRRDDKTLVPVTSPAEVVRIKRADSVVCEPTTTTTSTTMTP